MPYTHLTVYCHSTAEHNMNTQLLRLSDAENIVDEAGLLTITYVGFCICCTVLYINICEHTGEQFPYTDLVDWIY